MLATAPSPGRPVRRLTWLPWCAVLSLVVTAPHEAPGQSPRARPRPANPAEVKRLDTRFEEVQSEFVRETTSLLTSYESLGQFDRVKAILEAFVKLDPKNEQLKAKISELDERMLQASEFEMRLQPGDAWQAVGVVQKDRPIRIRVSGDYRFQVSGSVTADGVTSEDPQAGLVSQIPFGAVMGVIIPANQAADAKAPRPFLVGSAFNRNAERDGVLHLRANVPAGTKCTGRLDLLVSGPQQP